MCFVKQCFQINDGSHFDEVYQLAADMGGAMYNNSGAYDADIMSNSSLMNINILKCSVMFNAKKVFFPSSACVYPVATCIGFLQPYAMQHDSARHKTFKLFIVSINNISKNFVEFFRSS